MSGLPVSLTRRRALSLLACGAGTSVFAGPKSWRFRFLSYNIHHGKGLDGKLDLGRIAVVIRDTMADLIALQEVDQGTERSGKIQQAEELARLLGKRVFFAKAMDHDGGEYGNAILYPHDGSVWETRRVPLDEGDGEPRVAAMVAVPVEPGLRFWFTSVHLDHRKWETRAGQMKTLLAALPKPDAILLAGDLNADREETSRLLPRPWRNFEKTKPSATVPAGKPEKEIDHLIWRASDRLDLVPNRHVVVPERMASDHRPVFLDAALTRSPEVADPR